MNSMLLLAGLVMGGPAVRFDPPAVKFDPPSVLEIAIAKSKEVPYAALYALCENGGSGTLYVGIPAPKDVKGVYAVLPADNREGIAVGVYDCGPNNTFAKRAVAEAKAVSSWSPVPGTTCRLVRLPNGQLVQECR